MREMLELYRAHPGSARAAMGIIPTGSGAIRATEGMLSVCLAGGITPQAAAWFCDLARALRRRGRLRGVDLDRPRQLHRPPARRPTTRRSTPQLTDYFRVAAGRPVPARRARWPR